MPAIDLDTLIAATSPGGSTCLTSVTDLQPAAGPQAAIAPAKFAQRGRDTGTYAYERRYLDGQVAQAVLIDSKQSMLNRGEAALDQAIADEHPVLSRMPRIEVTYGGEVTETFSDLTLPHRAFDGHIRAGTVDGAPVTELPAYRAARDATPANARALLDVSPISLVMGSWDSSRASRQGRWRSVLVGEIVGFCSTGPDERQPLKGGARLDPAGQRVELSESDLKALAESQRGELSRALYDKLMKPKVKSGGKISAAALGLGGIPPTLEALAGIACHRIIRSHVLSFAALRQIRFGAGVEGDAACRALLAALALNALARSDSELVLRANCDLRESGPTVVAVDQRGGREQSFESLTIETADELLAAALAEAERRAGVVWEGVAIRVTGNPAIVAGAVEDETGEA